MFQGGLQPTMMPTSSRKTFVLGESSLIVATASAAAAKKLNALSTNSVALVPAAPLAHPWKDTPSGQGTPGVCSDLFRKVRQVKLSSAFPCPPKHSPMSLISGCCALMILADAS